MEKHWIDEFFGPAYLDVYLEMLTPERTKREVDLIEETLALQKDEQILDLASGHGRHAIELARRGYKNVVGLDYTTIFVEKAKKDAQAQGVRVEFVLGDMRNLTYKDEFDAVYNYFTAMFFFSDEVNQGILEGVARALKPGGRLLMETMNREWLIHNFQARRWHEIENGPRVLEESRFDPYTDRLFNIRHILYPDGREIKQEFDFSLYPVSTIKRMMEHVALELVEAKAAEGELFPPESPRLILVAKKTQ